MTPTLLKELIQAERFHERAITFIIFIGMAANQQHRPKLTCCSCKERFWKQSELRYTDSRARYYVR